MRAEEQPYRPIFAAPRFELLFYAREVILRAGGSCMKFVSLGWRLAPLPAAEKCCEKRLNCQGLRVPSRAPYPLQPGNPQGDLK